MTRPPVVVHIIYRLAIGGLENGLVNLINHMPRDKYRHAIICATDYTDFKNRITRDDVEVYALNKRPGNDLSAYLRLWKLLRRLKPDIVHTRNLGTMEYAIPAMLAGVSCRVHGEHGRDMTDIDGSNRKYIKLRKLYQPFIHRFVALSRDLESWLTGTVNIPARKVVQLYNGVDLSRFDIHNSHALEGGVLPDEANAFFIGTVGRLQAEKDQATLVRAFSHVLKQDKVATLKPYLIIVGDGPDRARLDNLVYELGIEERVLFLGARNDVPQVLSHLDVFVLPSLGEGISNTILEAMASSLPVVATAVGGNPELVTPGQSGYLVPPNDPAGMAEAIQTYLKDPELARQHGTNGRARVEADFSLEAMVGRYQDVYDALLAG